MNNLKRLRAVFAAAFTAALLIILAACPGLDTESRFTGTIAISPAENVYYGTPLGAVYSGSETDIRYQWNKDGAAVAGATGTAYTPASPGTYTVTVSKDGYTSITSAAVTAHDAVNVSYETLAEDLAAITGGESEAAPVLVKLAAITLSTAESTGWGEIYAILAAAQKYVVLDLSECSFTDSAVTGKFTPAGNDMNIIRESAHIKGVIIPEGVMSIGNYAFTACTGLTGVTIPEGVTYIGNNAFSGCTGLTSVTIPGSVTSIETGAFSGCTGLTSVTIPGSVTSIETGAFSGCTGLADIRIPASVTSIGDWAFSDCTGLTGITIPDSVTTIGVLAFLGCTGLTGITVDPANTAYASVEGVLYTKAKDFILQCPGGKSGALTIPSGVTSISDSAFHGCTGLTSISIPGSVTYIGNSAFSGCTGLTGVTFAGAAVAIGMQAFPGSSGVPSDTLKTAYEAVGTGGAGTYTRTIDMDDWAKQP